MDRLRNNDYCIHCSQPPDRIWTGCYKFSDVQSGDCLEYGLLGGDTT